MLDRIRDHIDRSSSFVDLLGSIQQFRPGSQVRLGGVAGSLLGFILSSLSRSLARQILVVIPDRQQAEQLFDDLNLLHGDAIRQFNFHPAQSSRLDPAFSSGDSIAALRSLLERSVDIVVASPGSIAVQLPPPDTLKSNNISIEAGKDYVLTELIRQLDEADFEKRDFVGAPGEYAHRGGILDLYSYASEYPVRAEFCGDAIDSIREFDPLSQRSIREISVAMIVPNVFSESRSAINSSRSGMVIDYLRPDTLVIMVEPEMIGSQIEETHAHYPDQVVEPAVLHERMSSFIRISVESLSGSSGRINFNSLQQPAFNGDTKILREHLLNLKRSNYQVFIACDGQSELKRLRELICELPGPEDSAAASGEIEELKGVEFIHHALHSGFVLPDQQIACYTEHQIFGRHKRRGRRRKARVRGFSPKELQQLRKGDFVVHEDFGIGRFDGLKKICVRDVEQEVMKLLYEEKDTLYVNLNYLSKVQKFSSKDGHIPKLTRLGTQEWDKLKARAKKRIQDIARDLIRLYARRKSSQGFAFQTDTTWQKELEASFIYEDTFDQAKATLDVKQDMEQSFPMDRLVCGDVGFGKTEVAVRAAFKAVLDGKQVAVLVPTTILAIQHCNTFLDRTSRFSVRVAVISRLKSKKEQAAIIDQLRSGAIDIVIGTHRLLSKDVQFKDLGLLVVDEEHRFGVTAKEKLRQMRANVDTLTLTATPIPRTLHFSLMGARDLSIIGTPPRNRLPIITEITQFSEELIKEAVTREMDRKGQVYFVHDRVNDIEEWTERLRVLLPGRRIHHAHGQMPAHELEEVMLEFQERKCDVLVCTKIIESGLDIPNVNTIIVNRADRFGMSELYQLKGRVGRSNVQAYAHLLVPPISVLPRTTIQRLQAIEEFTELGSGFNLAMRDLEIRGAGNLLGAEQSGFIESMGFETYTHILDEAVTELKQQEFKDFFPVSEGRKRLAPETVVEVELDALIPASYIESDMERLEIYRRMYALSTHEQLQELGEELKDRFGTHPIQVQNLFNAVRVRLVAASLGFRKGLMGKHTIEIEFPPDSDTAFYESPTFQRLTNEISSWKDKNVRLKQDEKVLKLVVRFVEGQTAENPIEAAIRFLRDLETTVKSTLFPSPQPASG